MKILFTLSLSLVLLACGSAKEASETAIETPAATIGEIDYEAPTANILSAVVEGNYLNLEVSFSGGCEEQSFELVGSPMLMKSMPPKRGIRLIRDPKGDACRELVTKKLRFNINALAYSEEVGSEVILLLDGYKEELKYTLMQ